MSEQHNTNPSNGADPNAGTMPPAGQDPNQAGQQPPQPQPEPGEGAQPLVIRGHEIPADIEKVEDPDLQEFYRSLVMIHEQENAKQGKEGDAGQPATQPPQTAGQPQAGDQPPAQTAQPQPVQGAEPMIPKARFDAAIAQARGQADYWRGIAEARVGMQGGQPANPGQQQPNQTTPEQRLTAIASEMDALADKFDNGELSMKELTAAQRKLQDEAFDLRRVMLVAEVEQRIPVPQEDLTLTQKTMEIEAQHPYLPVVFPDKPVEQLTPIEQSRQQMIREEATAAVVAENPGIKPGPRADLLFRAKLGEIADRYGAIWYPNAKPQAQKQPAAGTTQTPPASQPPPGGKPALTEKQEQRLNKLTLADRQPPTTANLGTQASGMGDYTPERIAQMSEDEYARLPNEIRQRLRGET